MSSPLPLAAARADGNALPLSVCFSVQARAEPGVMPRVVGLFAKRGLVPQEWYSTASADALTIDVQIAGLDRDLSGYIARCMRQITGVETVLTSENHASG
jgi:acetolactate synthase small subunit